VYQLTQKSYQTESKTWYIRARKFFSTNPPAEKSSPSQKKIRGIPPTQKKLGFRSLETHVLVSTPTPKSWRNAMNLTPCLQEKANAQKMRDILQNGRKNISVMHEHVKHHAASHTKYHKVVWITGGVDSLYGITKI